MSKRKTSALRWEGDIQPSYYDLPSKGKEIKYYNEFIKNNDIYKVGNFAKFSTNVNDPSAQKFCMLKCLFEEDKEYKAVVDVYERAYEFKQQFYSMGVDFDDFNEVVLDSREEKIINLKCILMKCRIVIALKDQTVEEVLESSNLKKKLYYMCRFRYTQNGDLVPLLNEAIGSEVEIKETTLKRATPLKTPSRKIMSASRSIGVKKNHLDAIRDVEHDVSASNLSQVRRNLNSSFNNSMSQDENILNYSIVEPADENLVMKLRVSDKNVKPQIPLSQPVVLLEKIDLASVKNAMSSPSSKILLKKAIDVENARSSTPDSDLSNLVEDMEIKDESPVKKTPRKLRKLSTPLYNENFSDTDSDDFVGRRKVARSQEDTPVGVRRSTRTRKSGLYDGFDCLMRPVFNTPGGRRKQTESDIPESNCSGSKKKSTKSSKKNEMSEKGCYTPSSGCKKKAGTPSVGTPRGRPKKTVIETPATETPRGRTETPKTVKGTPLKLLRNGMLTPSVDQRLKGVEKCATPLVMARNTLHVSYVPKLLPCREKEYRDIYNFIEGKLRDKCGGCMYISGVPGTGKTATVTAAIANITKTWKNESYGDFNYVSINGMKLTEPRQCYAEIYKQLTGKRVPWEQALTILEKQFTTKSSKKVVPTVLLIDELDILCTKRQDVVYNLLDWPTKTNAQLIVVTIANTMDLPERLLMSRVTSRLGLTRLTFQAYTHKQLQEIVINRLSGNESFKADAIQFVARKVASVSGDARRALDICRRSAEIAELEGPLTQVSMKHVNAALEAMITQPKVKAILHCSKLEKLLLKAVIAEVERTGLEETIFEDVCMTLNSLATLEGFKMVSLSRVTAAVYKLTSCRLLLSEQNNNGLDQRILLNVSSDDVYYALKTEL